MACGNGIAPKYGSDQTSKPTTASLQAGMYISSNATPPQVRCHDSKLASSYRASKCSKTPNTTTSLALHRAVQPLGPSAATVEDLELHSVDFTKAIIQADCLPEGVNGRFFISLSPGSPHANTSGIVYEVLRPLYGVPSSPRALHKTLDSYFKGEGLRTRCLKNPCGIAPPMRNMLLML